MKKKKTKAEKKVRERHQDQKLLVYMNYYLAHKHHCLNIIVFEFI